MQTYKPAGFWIRVVASVLDAIFASIASFIVTAIVGEYTYIIYEPADPDLIIEFPIVNFSVSLLYAIIFIIFFTASKFKGSPGKLICQIQVLNTNMTQITIGKSIGRYLAMIISAIPFGIGFLMAGWNREKKALHDIICNTRVVYRNQNDAEEEPVLYE